MVPSFIHLRVHTEYSISDGLAEISQLIERTHELKMPAIAVTDSMNLFAMVKFYRQAMQSGTKPIIGADLWLGENNQKFLLTCLCQNQHGYRNLTRLISKAYQLGQENGQPLIQWQWLIEHHQGLIVLSGAQFGEIGQALLAKNTLAAKECLQRYSNLFENRFYIELQRTQRSQEDEYNHAALLLASEHQTPVVATNDVRFLLATDFEAHEARVCIQSGDVLADERRPRLYSREQYLKSPEEMTALFADIPESLENTVEIAKRCNMQIELGQAFFPDFPLPPNITLTDYIQQQARQGLKNRLAERNDLNEEKINIYQNRLQWELDIINSMGFAGYFLIVADFIRWAKQQNIPVGPGRGSGAGSLVAYALEITGLDPIFHELLFERFLNPERKSLPDFDIDFCMERRDEVIEYVAQRYGRDAVAQIITFGTMAARAVVRDVGRVLGMPYGFVDKIAKLIPFELGVTLEKALAQEPILARRYDEEEDVKNLIDLAKKLEGVIRNAGKHAGGVVIAPTCLTDFTPIYCEPGSKQWVTQYDKDDVEGVGLVKFDFLGLRTLTIIHWALQTINRKLQKLSKPSVDIQKIPLDDAKTFQLLKNKNCATTAVFQLESRGMKDLIRRLSPDIFEEIVALVALFRPGPLQSGMVDDYIDRKHGRAPVDYPHPVLKPVLRSTHGVILYQEQVLQIAQVMAGYSLGAADILRSAIGKKKAEEMSKQRAVFIEGATKRHIDSSIANHVFDLIEKFAGYGFNKSHSTAYAFISYQTAWLKAHYPAEFMAAVLSSDMDNTNKMIGLLDECKRMKLTVLSPDIQASDYYFTVNEKNEITYGLGAIKGVGETAIQHLMEERQARGHFLSLFDFCRRLDQRKINRRAIEPLIYSGAMDCFGVSRSSLLATIDKAWKVAEQQQTNMNLGQVDLFATLDQQLSQTILSEYIIKPDWELLEKLQYEKATLGFYFSGHPLQCVFTEINQLTTAPLHEIQDLPHDQATIAGTLISIKKVTTRTGKRMAVLSLEDFQGRMDVTVFAQLYEEVQEKLEKDKVYIISGKLTRDEFTGGKKIIADTIMTLEEVRVKRAKKLKIHLLQDEIVDLGTLQIILEKYVQGPCPVHIHYQNDEVSGEIQLGRNWHVHLNNNLLAELNQICGEKNIEVVY